MLTSFWTNEGDFRHLVSPGKDAVDPVYPYLLRPFMQLVRDFALIAGQLLQEVIILTIGGVDGTVIGRLDYPEVRYIQFSFWF